MRKFIAGLSLTLVMSLGFVESAEAKTVTSYVFQDEYGCVYETTVTTRSFLGFSWSSEDTELVGCYR